MQTYSDDEDSHFFLGKMISPSITPGSDTQPGYTTFTLEDNQIKDIVMTFLQLDSQQGLPQTATFEEFDWLVVDYAKEFGMTTLSSTSISELNQRLRSDNKLFKKYMSYKAGFVD